MPDNNMGTLQVNDDNIEVLEEFVPFNESDIPSIDYEQEYNAAMQQIQIQASQMANMESTIHQLQSMLESQEQHFDKIVARLVIKLLGDN